MPDVPEMLSRRIVGFVQRLRELDLFKSPGVAETIDWTNALVALDKVELDPENGAVALDGQAVIFATRHGHHIGETADTDDFVPVIGAPVT